MLALLLLVACSQSTPQATGTVKTDTTPTAPVTAQEETQTAVEAEPDTNAGDPATLKLFERNSQVKSYKFDLAPLPERIGTHTYYLRGNKVAIDPLSNDGYSTGPRFDKVYLDLEAMTATAYCVDDRTCRSTPGPHDLPFEEWTIIYPHEWIEQIKYGRKISSLTFENKPVSVVRYEADGKYYEAYIDNYFGYPQRIAIATDPEMENIIGGYEYRAMGFNTITEADVTYTPK